MVQGNCRHGRACHSTSASLRSHWRGGEGWSRCCKSSPGEACPSPWVMLSQWGVFGTSSPAANTSDSAPAAEQALGLLKTHVTVLWNQGGRGQTPYILALFSLRRGGDTQCSNPSLQGALRTAPVTPRVSSSPLSLSRRIQCSGLWLCHYFFVLYDLWWQTADLDAFFPRTSQVLPRNVVALSECLHLWVCEDICLLAGKLCTILF